MTNQYSAGLVKTGADALRLSKDVQLSGLITVYEHFHQTEEAF